MLPSEERRTQPVRPFGRIGRRTLSHLRPERSV
jgi:hypothetical protein